MTKTSVTFLLSLLLCFFAGTEASYAQNNATTFNLRGKVFASSERMDNIEMVVINAERLDSFEVELHKGKFDFLLGLNTTYLLIVREHGKPIKKILISTWAPVTSSAYKMKLQIDLSGSNQHGIAEYNGFEHRFVLKALQKNELKRRKQEFLAFYDFMIRDMMQ